MRRFIIEKDFIVNGYRCIIIGNNLGYRCGYIEIPEDHSLHGKHYSVIDDIIDIHGGWTYSNFTNNNYPTKASLKSWWIGFDAAHWGDVPDIELIKSFGNNEMTRFCMEIAELFSNFGAVITKEYVENELIEATKQLKRLNKLRI